MDLPIELREAIENTVSGRTPAELKKAVSAISDRYRNDSGKGNDSNYDIKHIHNDLRLSQPFGSAASDPFLSGGGRSPMFRFRKQ